MKMMPRKVVAFFPVEARFVAGLYLVMAVFFAALRLLLLLRNETLATPVATSDLFKSFLYGLRFDLAVSSYLLIPLLLLILAVKGRWRGWILAGFVVLCGGRFFLGIVEAEFYGEFESRFNALVFEYLGHPKIVAGMIWDGYPVVRYTVIWG